MNRTDAYAVELLAERGIDSSSHRSVPSAALASVSLPRASQRFYKGRQEGVHTHEISTRREMVV
jgi:hypothetical protein